ncbi:hypothetical protein JWS13_27515 [Rhodococcus pseudokoreensis]|uniref:Uncharacterized protein n=1 Tax=Rhodococcus pseudokoreensis TaxID=2811421 RepID=A0A974W6K1_9NOCA|nr:hypothetical protein [Rhodococcus pseudokoreensis]QSE92115.1 hypothetical protein JWS13_27515 [Rhodococcus pseudokoreensis]
MRGDVLPRPARLEGLDHRAGEALVVLVTVKYGISAVNGHGKSVRSGALDEHGVVFASMRL